MKLIAFWVLVLLAVLIPATAVVASATTSPPAGTELRRDAVQGNVSQHATVAGLHAKAPKAKAKVKTQTPAADAQGDHCCDLTPCSHCAGCGSCAAMTADSTVAPSARPFAVMHLPVSGPRAEFLLSGQERPPRAC